MGQRWQVGSPELEITFSEESGGIACMKIMEITPHAHGLDAVLPSRVNPELPPIADVKDTHWM